MAHSASTPLLELLESRKAWEGYEDRKLNDLPVYAQPQWTTAQLGRIEAAARMHAKVNIGDPFAYGRIKLHMIRGLAHSEEVMRDATTAQLARRPAND